MRVFDQVSNHLVELLAELPIRLTLQLPVVLLQLKAHPARQRGVRLAAILGHKKVLDYDSLSHHESYDK